MFNEEKIVLLKSEPIDKEILLYLQNKLKRLNVEVRNDYKGNLFDLMQSGKLRGWCWQSSETVALFLPDTDKVIRGNLHFNEKKIIYHGFIVFKYKDNEYVFDPCFGLINSKDNYFKVLKVEIKGKTSARAIKDSFLKKLNNSTIHNIYGDDDPNSPMFRNNTKYRDIVVMDDCVVEATAHYNMYTK